MNKVCLCCGRPLQDATSIYWHKACIRRFFGGNEIPTIEINAVIHDQLAEKSIEEGISVPGVQKKLSVSLRSSRKTIAYSGDYIIKTSAEDKPFLPELEYVGMKLAEICGFRVVPNGLIRSSGGEWIYITKRIDRLFKDGNTTKIAMEDFAQLSLTQTEYKYHGSYERCVKNVIKRYSITATLDTLEFFKMVFFSYIIGNTDMHLKNFSLIKGNAGYSLSSFYDILPVMMVVDQYEMALTINGKNQKLTKNDFLSFAISIGIEKELASKLIQSILNKMDDMFQFVECSPLPKEKREALQNLIKQRSIPFVN